MIYLDYSATTPVHKEVLETFTKVTTTFFGNPNSNHKLGREASGLIESATKQIANLMKIKESEIIYTSGATESNNLALKGIAFRYQNRGNHIITTKLEHSSVIGPIGYLQSKGFEVDFVELDEFGRVDLTHLQSLIKDTTVLVSISSVSSELGIRQPISEIAKVVKQYPKCFFHVDATQSLGKHSFGLEDIDLASFSAQKFFGMKGIGFLVKKDHVSLEPLLHGGKSTTVFRSGTPATPLIASLSKAVRLSLESLDEKYQKVMLLNQLLTSQLVEIEGLTLNVTKYTIPHIMNISIKGMKPETIMNALEQKEIYISSQSACSGDSKLSKAVYELTKSEELATTSLRISLSHVTTEEEIQKFVEALREVLTSLRLK